MTSDPDGSAASGFSNFDLMVAAAVVNGYATVCYKHGWVGEGCWSCQSFPQAKPEAVAYVRRFAEDQQGRELEARFAEVLGDAYRG